MKFKLSTSSLVTAACLASTAQMAHATDVFRLEGFGAISRAMGGVSHLALAAVARSLARIAEPHIAIYKTCQTTPHERNKR